MYKEFLIPVMWVNVSQVEAQAGKSSPGALTPLLPGGCLQEKEQILTEAPAGRPPVHQPSSSLPCVPLEPARHPEWNGKTPPKDPKSLIFYENPQTS